MTNMLNIERGKPISVFVDPEYKHDDRFIYLSEKDESLRLKTTPENKLEIFKAYLKSKKIRNMDIERLVDAYLSDDPLLKDKLGRIFDDAKEYVDKSDYRYMKFDDVSCMPVLDLKTSKRIYVTGSSGSGKTFWLTQFIKLNRLKGQQVYLFSPFINEGLPGVKNLIDVNISDFEEENQRPFSDEDVQDGSIVVLDDIESHRTHKKQLIEIRNILLERARHRSISIITVSHNPMQGQTTKQSLRECNYFVVFRNNERDTRNLLDKYCNMSKELIDELLESMCRYLFISRDVPKYCISNNFVRLI